jgi:hypothetical protein
VTQYLVQAFVVPALRKLREGRGTRTVVVSQRQNGGPPRRILGVVSKKTVSKKTKEAQQ